MISDETKDKRFAKIRLIEEAKFGNDLLLNYMMQCGHAVKIYGNIYGTLAMTIANFGKYQKICCNLQQYPESKVWKFSLFSY